MFDDERHTEDNCTTRRLIHTHVLVFLEYILDSDCLITKWVFSPSDAAMQCIQCIL